MPVLSPVTFVRFVTWKVLFLCEYDWRFVELSKEIIWRLFAWEKKKKVLSKSEIERKGRIIPEKKIFLSNRKSDFQ